MKLMKKGTQQVDDDVPVSIFKYSTNFVHIACEVFGFFLIISPYKLSPVSEMPSKMPN